MNAVQIVLGVLLLISAVFLVVAVLMQDSKKHGLSGAISGGAETYFGKQKGTTMSKRLSKLTVIIAIVFVLIVLVLYVIQDQVNFNDVAGNDTAASTESTADTDETTADPDETTAEPEGTTAEPEGTTAEPAGTTAAE